MSQKNVLVIGGSGFIGSHLVDELISKKYKVSVLDIKKSKYHNKNAKLSNVPSRIINIYQKL